MGISIQGLKCGHNDCYGWHSGPDSAGGVSVIWDFTNTGTKTIKYATFGFIPYNAVGDAVVCSISDNSEQFAKFTGPLAPNASHRGTLFENAWYNHSITSVRVSKVIIQYMDETEETINGSDIPITSATSNTSGGCYIATAVYGSYDCPEVWTLRRYRDYTLAKTWYGRVFIHMYYAVSPTLVKWFGDAEWFKKIWKGKLDRMVANLQVDGVESLPYEDKNW